MNGFFVDENVFNEIDISNININTVENNEDINISNAFSPNNYLFNTNHFLYNNLFCGQQAYNEESEITFENKNNFKLKETDQNTNQRETLILQLSTFQYECTICYVILKPDNQVWSCDNCYHIFHITCIKKWYKTCLSDSKVDKWRCPTCQKHYSLSEDEIIYRCFCGKLKSPNQKRSSLMHSCDDVCGKPHKSSSRCPHLCSMQCHPGPCPPCEAFVTIPCNCTKSNLTVKCSTSESNLICGSLCGKPLACGLHFCQSHCHPAGCEPCTEIVVQHCYCCKQTQTVLCGAPPTFSCLETCGRLRDCSVHVCEEPCHQGNCEPCPLMPERVRFCHCGQTPIEALLPNTEYRRSCLDPIPLCGLTCSKPFSYCEHLCPVPCHTGPCPPCGFVSTRRCRCRKTNQTVKCTELARLAELGRSLVCSSRCKSKQSCGQHRCQDICCDKQSHVCEQQCRRLLSCGHHRCETPCHLGNCLPCSNVSFDELACRCGEQVALPPIACGQARPPCDRVCSRPHQCDHEVSHPCHDELDCPVCIVLTRKPCPGLHKMFDNVPCFRPVATCGSRCDRPLVGCEHHCTRDCHSGPCQNADVPPCIQPCGRPRSECAHPCAAPCHLAGECQTIGKPCEVTVELRCSCGLKTGRLVCHKLQLRAAILRSNSVGLGTSTTTKPRKDGIELCLSPKDQSVMISCDGDCRKMAKQKQNIDTSKHDPTPNENVTYTSFLRDFSTANPSFLVKIDAEFIKLIKTLESDRLHRAIHRFEPMNRDKRRFIHELSKYFYLTSINSESDSKQFVIIEAVKGISKVPGSRFLHFMQKNYPQLFKADSQLSMKHFLLQNSASRQSHSNKIKWDFSKNL